MIADHPQHMGFVALIAAKRAQLASDFRASGIRNAGHNGRQRPTQGPPLDTVVSVSQIHQQTANIGEPKAKRAKFITALGNLF